jgi:hypothetical protein
MFSLKSLKSRIFMLVYALVELVAPAKIAG